MLSSLIPLWSNATRWIASELDSHPTGDKINNGSYSDAIAMAFFGFYAFSNLRRAYQFGPSLSSTFTSVVASLRNTVTLWRSQGQRALNNVLSATAADWKDIIVTGLSVIAKFPAAVTMGAALDKEYNTKLFTPIFLLLCVKHAFAARANYERYTNGAYMDAAAFWESSVPVQPKAVEPVKSKDKRRALFNRASTFPPTPAILYSMAQNKSEQEKRILSLGDRRKGL